jgi:hypothetical protein
MNEPLKNLSTAELENSLTQFETNLVEQVNSLSPGMSDTAKIMTVGMINSTTAGIKEIQAELKRRKRQKFIYIGLILGGISFLHFRK